MRSPTLPSPRPQRNHAHPSQHDYPTQATTFPSHNQAFHVVDPMYYRTDTSSQPSSSANPQLFRPHLHAFFLRARGGGDGGVLRGFGAGDDTEAGVALVEDLGKEWVLSVCWLLFVCMYV